MSENEFPKTGSVPQELDFDEIVHKYGDLVYSIVFSRLRTYACHEEIKDCVSDVFAALYAELDKFSEEKGTMKAFICSIAKNTAINAYKRMSYSRSRTVSLEDEGVREAVSSQRTDDDVDSRIECTHLLELVKALGEPDSAIIIYRYYYQLRSAEIAERLSMTPEAVRKRCQRARERLKAVLISERSGIYDG